MRDLRLSPVSVSAWEDRQETEAVEPGAEGSGKGAAPECPPVSETLIN